MYGTFVKKTSVGGDSKVLLVLKEAYTWRCKGKSAEHYSFLNSCQISMSKSGHFNYVDCAETLVLLKQANYWVENLSDAAMNNAASLKWGREKKKSKQNFGNTYC